VVLRYRLELESRRLTPSSINLRLAAVRRLAYEAADTGLLSPELAAGILDSTKHARSRRMTPQSELNWAAAGTIRFRRESPIKEGTEIMPHRKRQRLGFTWLMQTRRGIIRQAA